MTEKSDATRNDVEKLKETYSSLGDVHKKILNETRKVVVGQEEVVEQMLTAIYTDSHALLEGFPGLGKTLMVRTIADVMDLKFRRLQCTPDLMPSDVTGTYVIEETDGHRKEFRYEEGPVFTSILLADEINRATPKAQSALLEAMQERQVTAGNQTFKLDRPFFVLATQNPIEMEGTYPLPEAQVDRFLMKILVTYPDKDGEGDIVDLYTGEAMPKANKVISRDKVLNIQKLTRMMPISKDVKAYAINIARATRPEEGATAGKFLDYGASPRASIGLILAAKARALIKGRNYVSKEDVEKMAFPVLRHRLILNFESERKGVKTDDVIAEVIKTA